jgi:fermentation-respiration switch protein FrsA (DUF1100 family)
VKKVIILAVPIAVLLTARWGSTSTLCWVVTVLGPTVLLDKWFFRLLRWPYPIRWPRELAVRLGYLVGGGVLAYVLRLGYVPVCEAILLGAAVSLAAAVLEALAAVVACATGWRLVPRFMALGPVILAAPLIALHPLPIVPARTPAAQGLAFEEVRFHAADGVRLAGWLVPHPQARGNVIFCHGWGRNRGQGAGLFPLLHDMRLNVLAFDFRGHGDSTGHTATFGWEEVQDVLAAAAFVRQRYPGQPLFLVGVSYGAAVTLQALPQLGDVAGVWSEGCFARLENVVTHFFEPLPAELRTGLASVCSAAAWLDCGLHSRDINPIDALDGIHVPIYFCHGWKDELVPWSEAEALYQSYAGPKNCWWVEHGTHYDLRQRHRDEYRDRLRSFLEARLQGHGIN